MRILNILFCFVLIMISVQSCNDPCDDINCGPNGTCVDGTCECDEGFLGTNCEQTLCDTVNCGPNGTCNPSTGDCDCDPGFSGSNCEINICDSIDCVNGECDPATATCICNEGFEGDNCDTEIRAKHFGTYSGDLTGCIPAFLLSLIPAGDLETLETTPLEVFASDNGVTLVNIGSMSTVLNLNVEADVTMDEFTIPEFSQSVDVQGQVITISGEGSGMLADENNMNLNLELVYDLGALTLTQDCMINFVKQ